MEPVDRAGLRPEKTRTANSGATDFVKPPEEIQPGFENIWRRTLVPEEVARYSNDGRNKIHSDPEIARQFCFRAPIAAGLIAVHYYLEAVAHRCASGTLDIEIWFKRPMFWDETLTLRHKTVNGQLTGMRIDNKVGKVASMARINTVG